MLTNLRARGQTLSQAEWDTLFLHILATLPGRLLPGVSTAEVVPPGAAVDPVIALADSAVTLRASNIRRFPNNALLGMQQGAVMLALLENGRVSQDLFNAVMAGGGAVSDEVAAQAVDLYNQLKNNMPEILAAATGEAVGADLQRAVASVIEGESEEDLAAGRSLFPIIPGFGVPEAKEFTEKEATDLREKFKKQLERVLPTTNQLDSVEERATRRRFIDDVDDEAQAIIAQGGPDELRRLQAILDNAPDRFEVVREATVAETEAKAEELAAELGTPESFKKALSNLPGIPTAAQLETPEEKDALKKFLDDTVDRAEAAAAAVRASPHGFTERDILGAKETILAGAAFKWQQAQFVAVQAAAAAEATAEAKEAFEEAETAAEAAEKAAPTTVADKNAILSAAFQTEAFQSIMPGVEFEGLTDEVKALARSGMSGMSAEEAQDYALSNALSWVHASRIEEAKAEAEGVTDFDEFNELIEDASIADPKTGFAGFVFGDLSKADKSLLANVAVGVSRAEQISLVRRLAPGLIAASKEAAEAEENAPAVSDDEMDTLIEDVLLGREKELENEDIAEIKHLLATPGLTRAQQIQIAQGTGTRLIQERRGIEAGEAAATFTIENAREQVRQLYVGSGRDPGEVPKDIREKAVGDVFRAGGLTPDLGQDILDRLEGELGAFAEVQGFGAATKSSEALEGFGTNIAVEQGLLGPNTPPEFAQHLLGSTIPRIAQAAALSGFGTTEELQGFFEDELTPGESTLGLIPPDVDPSDFARQMGFGGFMPREMLRPEEPIPESAFLPSIREAAGDDPELFQYLLSQTEGLVTGFGTAKKELEHRLSLENLQQRTAFAQTPSQLAPLEERLARHRAAAEARKVLTGPPFGTAPLSGFDVQGFLSPAELEALQAEIARVRGSVRENLGALATQQARGVQREVAGFTPQQFFEGRREGLVAGFRDRPGALAAAERQREVDVAEAERVRRRRLRGRGRTVVRT